MTTTKKVVGAFTIVGAGILLVNSALQIAGAKKIKQALFPALGILVGFAAFNYAMQDINKPELLTASSED
jgi:uncharacterized membrane protein YqgA involved in biofilm formation